MGHRRFVDFLLFWGILLVSLFGTLHSRCGGKTEINGVLNGTIAIGQTPYPPNTHCEWLIKAPFRGQRIKLILKEFDTECSFDYLKIYDGSSTSAQLMAAFSGDTLPPVVLSQSPSMLLKFFSDNNYTRKGWLVHFVINNCSGDCSGHGNCVGHTCYCDDLYDGDACDVELCPQMCNNITDQGECSKSDGRCICNEGYVGQSCSISLHDDSGVGSWHVIKENSNIFQTRFGHAGVYVKENNSFWAFGGSDLNGLFEDLVKFDFVKNDWLQLTPSGPRPAARFRHTLVTYKDTLVLFGGEVANGTFVNDLWSFNMSTMQWKLLPGNAVSSPPGLASHTANVVGDKLFIFGGRSKELGFSYEMYTFDLSHIGGWEKVIYKLAKTSDLRLVGHTSVYYPALKSLVIFGGFKQLTIKRSEKVNTIYIYHLERKVWMEFTKLSNQAIFIPPPIAYHSSVVVGDYMVIYGGNIHKHSYDEKCYGNNIYLFNLKSFSWVSSALLTALEIPRNSSWQPPRGRFSLVATVINGRTLVISGGFSGFVNGDLLVYKFPSNIGTGNLSVTTISGKHCSRYNKNGCGLDPSCVWCVANVNCLPIHQVSSCSAKTIPVTPHICSAFPQCGSCLSWGSQVDLACGWCVQDSRCYPHSSPAGACSPRTAQNVDRMRGWWGENSLFLTTLDKCRTKDNLPGLMVNEYYRTWTENQPDRVSIVNPLRATFNPRLSPFIFPSSYDVKVRMTGFIYPFLSTPINNNVEIALKCNKSSVSLRLSTDEDPDKMDKVISFKNDEKEVKISRNADRNGTPLFPSPTVNKKYYMEVNAELKGSDKNVKLIVFMDGVKLSGSHLRPFYSSSCSNYSSCLQCLSDASCGWCSTSNMCVLRNNTPVCSHKSGESIHLILNSTYCETCLQYLDCKLCSEDGDCAWNSHQFCDRGGGLSTSLPCSRPCDSYKDCLNCTSDIKCLWCENKQRCLPWFSYPADFLEGHCSHWSDSNTIHGRCRNCNLQKTCKDCIELRHCGWCGEYHNGKCFEGGFEGPRDGRCDQLMGSNGHETNSSRWSYTKCPDENECITRRDCDSNAICTNFDGGYNCECRVGFEGDGFYCNVSCNPPCVHGICSSKLTCECDLGWTGNTCSHDCGCNNHSTCLKGVGVCDNCQEFTFGQHCEFCLPGSYGNATTSLGCTRCDCNEHGDKHRGICDVKTGSCFCMNNTMGKHCNQCLPGFTGHPERGGGCYYPCKAHSVLSNVTQGALSTTVGPGAEDPLNTNCVWIITTSRNRSQHIVYTTDFPTGTVTFRIKDLLVDCQTDHVYIYEGFPPYKLNSSLSSFNQIGSLCGFDASVVPTIESRTGTLVVVFKGNTGSRSFTKGFNATFVVNQCPNSCKGNRYCYNNGSHHSCICKAGWTGPGCDNMICPANCSEELGQGYCDQVYGSCVCAKGFAGETCAIQNPFNNFTWELVFNSDGKNSLLPRMGHTMVADERNQSLIIYGGFSFHHRILGDVLIYEINKKHMNRVQYNGEGPASRYLHAAAIYKRQMYIAGGITEKGFSSELWTFDVDSQQWTKAQNISRRVAGHTLTNVNNTMYLIGGYDSEDGCSTKVYVLELNSNLPWIELISSGDMFKACFGHTTVYDKETKSLIVFGKDAGQIKAGSDSATLAVLRLATKKWIVAPELQTNSRYFHLSMVVGHVMIVTGGYRTGTVQDFASESLVYDIRCEHWEKLDVKGVFPSVVAHSSTASINGEIYVFGGYNGIANDKLFRLNISSSWCSMFSTQSTCVNITGCSWCNSKSFNRSFCYNSDVSLPLTCSIKTVSGNRCSVSPVALPLTDEIISTTDPCAQYNASEACSTCIQAKDVQGKTISCFWAVDSRRCLSVHLQPMFCVFGLCGRLLREYDTCPGRCHRTSYCYDCLEQYNCGWCADPMGDGSGTCVEGTFRGPLNATCQSHFKDIGSMVNTPIWVSSVCLLEDECKNSHHQCSQNETCFNLEDKYQCRCKSGYTRMLSECVPVCRQGCVNGNCIDPDVCRCWFGWVGANCSTSCECHGKGNCLDERHLNNCTDCLNNTKGDSCERCDPGFVGQNGICQPCSERCNKNAEMCLTKEDHEIYERTKTLSPYGPRNTDSYICLCEDNSVGTFCENCGTGFFKLKKEAKCEPCRCRGHAATCSSNSGLNCDCKNNTSVSLFCSTIPSKTNDKCYDNQCSTCDKGYTGNPKVEGQQCYRIMRILQHFSLTRENSGNQRLFPGQTNFFYVYPSYTNADIRLTFDVFDGSINVYIATVDSTFKVHVNQNVTITIDGISHSHGHSDGLNKYTTFSNDTCVAVITEIRHRLVVTFPSEEHQLADKKFYLVVKAGPSGADGLVYFKQDNVKINLVVFFAVFFSCFFLLLSSVVIGWSIKHHIHSRQEVHNREVRDERLQSRPFGKFSFLLEYQSPSTSLLRHRKTTGSSRIAIRPMGLQSMSDYFSAVSTVMLQMPPTEKAKMSIVLGSTLTTLNPHQIDRLSKVKPKLSQELQTTNL